MEIEERIYRGDQARQVLENEAFAAAFADIKTEITEQWANSPIRDLDGREKLFQFLKMADKLQATLTSAMETGKLAKLELQHHQTLADRARRALGLT